MKITVNENREIVLMDVFSGVLFESPDKDEFGICMRDGGFEFNYGGNWYEAKSGKIKKMVAKKDVMKILAETAKEILSADK